ncbi:MAG: hypothetical protein IJ850_04430 [Alistipes sp.]|uniref:Uncharacterized protein n=1 Tax=Alistipes intestinihominis TaxID=3133172 RepID=A0ABV1GYM6_9BACT|nr:MULTISPECIES: hypothetical protein [Alistipes]MBR2217573.1 hypothetical protein [Alistipes sp.]
MSNFQEPKKQSEFATDIFIDFLMLNDYVGKMKIEMILDYTELTKPDQPDKYVRIPNKAILTREMIKISLKDTDLSINDFEEYLMHLEVMETMKREYISKSKIK